MVAALKAAPSEEIPALHVEPPLQVGTTYTNVATIREVIRRLDLGNFFEPSFLFEQMLWNPRFRGVNETRLNGLMSTSIRWEPGRDNMQGRRAAKAIEEDWPLIAPPSERKQLHLYGLNLGVGLAQKHWYVSQSTGRLIPRIRTYHLHWAYWHLTERIYKVLTFGDGLVDVESPSLADPQRSGLGLWVVHEPFGQHSWRLGLLHAAWEAWKGHNDSGRDQSRCSEKVGIGMVKAVYPRTKDAAAVKRFVDGLRKLGNEAVIPCAENEDGTKFDVSPLEFNGTGYDAIQRTKDSKAVDLAVLYLGHNLTTEAKGGSYAAANIGDLIRGDIKAADAEAEAQTYRSQVIEEWAEANFGDRELAPIPVYETDPPAINQQAANTLQLLAQAFGGFSKYDAIDLATLSNRFRIPLKPGVEFKAPAPAPAPQQTKPPAPSAPPGQENK